VTVSAFTEPIFRNQLYGEVSYHIEKEVFLTPSAEYSSCEAITMEIISCADRAGEYMDCGSNTSGSLML